jgi:hypothetical protein
MSGDYPVWQYYPVSARAPDWVGAFVGVVRAARSEIESKVVTGLTSDRVLSHVALGLRDLGYQVETGKAVIERIRRPVLFGPNGHERVAYEVDAVHDDLGIVVEIEAGRGARGNATYRDLIRASLIVGAKFLVLGVMLEYRHNRGTKVTRVASYNDAREQLDAIYASGRLRLPFDGLLLFGY